MKIMRVSTSCCRKGIIQHSLLWELRDFIISSPWAPLLLRLKDFQVLTHFRSRKPATVAKSFKMNIRVQWFWLFFTFWGITTHPWHPKGPRIWKLAKKFFQLHLWPAEIFGKNRKMRFFGLISKFNFRSPVWQIFTIFSSFADPGCLSRILIFTHPGSRISDPGSNNSNKRERWKKSRCQTFLCSHKI